LRVWGCRFRDEGIGFWVLGTGFRVYGARCRVEQRIHIPSTPTALDSPLTSADASGIRVHSVGFSV